MKKNKIIFIISEGIVCRNFLQTNFLNKIDKDNFEIVILSNEILINKFKEYDSYKVQYPNFILKIIYKVLRQRFYSINQNKSYKIFRKDPLYKSFKSRARWILSFPLSKNIFIYNSLLSIFNYFLNKFNKKNSSFLSKIFDNGSLLISTNPVGILESSYIFYAKKNEIPSIGYIRSFDNITTKGFIPNIPDKICVWNYQMFFEAVNIYNIKASNVEIIGPLHFNFYNQKFLTNRSKCILYATVAEELNPDDVVIVKKLRRDLPLSYKIIVRLHQNDRIERWEKINHIEGIEIFNPSESQKAAERVSTNDALFSLHEQLKKCFLIINTASTTTLEALSFKRPSLNIAFSINKSSKIERFYELEHYKYLEKSKNVYFCKSYNDILINLKKIYKEGWIEDEYFNSIVLGPNNTEELFLNLINNYK